MNLPEVTVKDLLEAGVHLGHKTFRWNPKMKKYIFGEKNSIHIIDLSKTLELLKNALLELHKSVSAGGKVRLPGRRRCGSGLGGTQRAVSRRRPRRPPRSGVTPQS